MDVFFYNDTATTEIYTLSLHDALPISPRADNILVLNPGTSASAAYFAPVARDIVRRDRKSTRLNSSHANISYAVFCLKKKIHFVSIRHSTTLSYIHLPPLFLDLLYSPS